MPLKKCCFKPCSPAEAERQSGEGACRAGGNEGRGRPHADRCHRPRVLQKAQLQAADCHRPHRQPRQPAVWIQRSESHEVNLFLKLLFS